MKCPKCQSLGFETGDRCRTCGYDFSLIAAGGAPGPEPDLPLHAADPLARMPLDTIVAPPAAVARTSTGARADALPLFPRTSEEDDQPLIRVPAAPRPPLAVRRTPEKPRRPASKSGVPTAHDDARRRFREPGPASVADSSPSAVFAAVPDETLRFYDEAAETSIHLGEPVAAKPLRLSGTASGPGRRLLAAAVDLLILLAIDATVIYFTLKMAALTPADWRNLPALPLLAFLGIVKASYFCAFTLVGGQTVGKMAAGIRVVSDSERAVDPGCAVRRTMAGAISLLTLGAGFLPVFFGPDRRALHDRLAGTRVIHLK
jgi:uncharacterized RDD family membrane protein YckC